MINRQQYEQALRKIQMSDKLDSYEKNKKIKALEKEYHVYLKSGLWKKQPIKPVSTPDKVLSPQPLPPDQQPKLEIGALLAKVSDDVQAARTGVIDSERKEILDGVKEVVDDALERFQEIIDDSDEQTEILIREEVNRRVDEIITNLNSYLYSIKDEAETYIPNQDAFWAEYEAAGDELIKVAELALKNPGPAMTKELIKKTEKMNEMLSLLEKENNSSEKRDILRDTFRKKMVDFQQTRAIEDMAILKAELKAKRAEKEAEADYQKEKARAKYDLEDALKEAETEVLAKRRKR